LTLNYKGYPHGITIRNHPELKIGTLRSIIRLIAEYLEIDAAELTRQLFGS